MATATATAPVTLPAETVRLSPGGVDCKCVIIGDRALKTYVDKRERDLHYNHQKRLAGKGLAPYVDDCVDVTLDNGDQRWAYWSGVAEVAEDRLRRKYPGKSVMFLPPEGTPERAEWRDLKDRIERAGYRWLDDHSGNWGYINGRAVVIDTCPYR